MANGIETSKVFLQNPLITLYPIAKRTSIVPTDVLNARDEEARTAAFACGKSLEGRLCPQLLAVRINPDQKTANELSRWAGELKIRGCINCPVCRQNSD